MGVHVTHPQQTLPFRINFQLELSDTHIHENHARFAWLVRMQDQACTKLGASNFGMYPPLRTNTMSPEVVVGHLRSLIDIHVTSFHGTPIREIRVCVVRVDTCDHVRTIGVCVRGLSLPHFPGFQRREKLTCGLSQNKNVNAW